MENGDWGIEEFLTSLGEVVVQNSLRDSGVVSATDRLGNEN